ncbi:MAG: flagellar hook assembly protein FlgD [Alphaproteobacteria bacterium]
MDAVNAAAASTKERNASPKERKTDIAGDFDNFLNLLTTQLANQDPLSPMDSDKFTEQLVQFASVEQSVATNTKLDEILRLIDTDQMGAGTGYLGKQVEADVSTLRLGRTGTASFAMNVDGEPDEVAVEVRDDDGETVASLTPPAQAGAQTVVWDGRNAEGLRAPAGTYTVEVTAETADGEPVPVSTRLSGTVEAVENEGGALFLDVDGQRVAIGDITAVRSPAATDEEEPSS